MFYAPKNHAFAILKTLATHFKIINQGNSQFKGVNRLVIYAKLSAL